MRLRSYSLQSQHLEGGLGRGPWLRGDHAAEASHSPRPHVVVLAAHRDQVLLGEGHLEVRRGSVKQVIGDVLQRPEVYLLKIAMSTKQ